MSAFLPELLEAWLSRVAAEGPLRAALAVGVGGIGWFFLRSDGVQARVGRYRTLFEVALGVVAVSCGLAVAVTRASVVDDAFVSFRYARNLVDGQGLTYNPGERVEGFTNWLWTVLVAAGHVVTGVELPAVALVLNLVVFTTTLVLATRVRDGAHGRVAVPLAALLLAGNAVFASHGTTGLETGLVGLLGLCALAALRRPAPRFAFAAGLALALATLARPDQALFYGVGGIAVALGCVGATAWRDALRRLGAYAAPASLVVALTLWRHRYYGEWAPNTAWAKSAALAYWSQGFVYAGEFWLGSAGWVWLVPLGLWLARPGGWRDPDARRLRAYVAGVIGLHTVYVLKIGGDFMAGRFWVCLLPPLAFVAEDVVRHAIRTGQPLRAAGVLAVLCLGVAEPSLVPARTIRWYLADEGSVYPVTGWRPIVIDHPSYRIGHAVGATLHDRGIDALIATGTIGMVGYYGQEPLLDLHGLTDRTVARQPLTKRGHIGHEKFADRPYLLARGVRLVQSASLCADGPHPDVTAVTLRGRAEKPWCLLTYERALMDRLRREAPEWEFVAFDSWLDGYLAHLDDVPIAQLRDDVAWFDEYYFGTNVDPDRRAVLTRRLAVGETALAPTAAAPPGAAAPP